MRQQFITISIVNKGDRNVSMQTIQCEDYVKALAAMTKEALADGVGAEAIKLAVANVCRESTVPASFPEKKKYPETFHFHPKTDEDVLDFYKNFKGLISEDMFDAKVKHVNLYNIQMKLPA
jgi:hypothetical protein